MICSSYLHSSIPYQDHKLFYNGEMVKKKKRNKRYEQKQSTCRCLSICSIWEIFDCLGRKKV